MNETTRDGFLGHRLLVEQPARGAHRAGLDAVLLAAALPDGTAGRVTDLGAGVGVAGLVVAARLPETAVTLVEVDPAAAALARANVAANAATVGDRVEVEERDALDPGCGLVTHLADHVIVNPPFHPTDRTRRSPAQARAAAHALPPEDLVRWMKAAARLLRPDGTLTVIFRADELPRLLAAVTPRFGSLAVLPVHPREDEPATRVILRARPQGRAPFRLLPGFPLHDAEGAWLPGADAVLRGAALPITWW